MSNVLEVTTASFAAEVLESSVPVVVDFWAPWCGPCRMLAPAMEAAEQALLGKAKVVKVNVDEQPGLAVQFQVQSIPTIIWFKGGKAVQRTMGVQSTDVIVKQALALV